MVPIYGKKRENAKIQLTLAIIMLTFAKNIRIFPFMPWINSEVPARFKNKALDFLAKSDGSIKTMSQLIRVSVAEYIDGRTPRESDSIRVGRASSSGESSSPGGGFQFPGAQ